MVLRVFRRIALSVTVFTCGIGALGCSSSSSTSSEKNNPVPVAIKESRTPSVEEEKIEIVEATMAKLSEAIASHKGKVVLVDIWAEF